ncbi:MAG: hypothetical protein NTZ90_04685 [Proteobacteria bacterium]|nr:hypothetical protein [Pseudomonadota bacterium]
MNISSKGLLNAVAAFAIVSLSGSAMAVTKPKSPTAGMHCVNSRNQEIKAATKLSECKAPYHWVKAPIVATKVKTKPNHALAHAKKHKGRVASTKKTINQ